MPERDVRVGEAADVVGGHCLAVAAQRVAVGRRRRGPGAAAVAAARRRRRVGGVDAARDGGASAGLSDLLASNLTKAGLTCAVCTHLETVDLESSPAAVAVVSADSWTPNASLDAGAAAAVGTLTTCASPLLAAAAGGGWTPHASFGAAPPAAEGGTVSGPLTGGLTTQLALSLIHI